MSNLPTINVLSKHQYKLTENSKKVHNSIIYTNYKTMGKHQI